MRGEKMGVNKEQELKAIRKKLKEMIKVMLL
jgi:hypothetical protein